MAICLDYQSVYTKRHQARWALRLQVGAALLLLVSLTVRVWLKLESTDVGYQLAKQRQKAVELDMQRRELELHQSVLLREDTLLKLASERLGLQPLARSQRIRVTY